MKSFPPSNFNFNSFHASVLVKRMHVRYIIYAHVCGAKKVFRGRFLHIMVIRSCSGGGGGRNSESIAAEGMLGMCRTFCSVKLLIYIADGVPVTTGRDAFPYLPFSKEVTNRTGNSRKRTTDVHGNWMSFSFIAISAEKEKYRETHGQPESRQSNIKMIFGREKSFNWV